MRARTAAVVARQPPAVLGRVDLEFAGADHDQHALSRLRFGDVVSAALEAEEPVAGDHARGALDH